MARDDRREYKLEMLACDVFEGRNENKMTQEQLANAVGCSQAAVSKWEHADALPEPQFLRALGELFDWSESKIETYLRRVLPDRLRWMEEVPASRIRPLMQHVQEQKRIAGEDGDELRGRFYEAVGALVLEEVNHRLLALESEEAKYEKTVRQSGDWHEIPELNTEV